MARNGSGVYAPPASDFPAVTGTAIDSTKFNNVINDIATALTGSLACNGESVLTANFAMGAYKITGLGAATARTDGASLANVQDGTGVYVGTVGGTADAITLTASPAITGYSAGQRFSFISSGANTTATTVNVSSVGVKSVTKYGSTALAAGDIANGALVTIVYDGTRFQVVSITTVASTSLSAAEILTAVKTVDGTGSGLDADLLDGQSSAAFAAASHTQAGSTITTAVRNVSGTTDSPTSADAECIVTLSSASATTVTLNSGVCAVGQSIAFYRLGAGTNTFAAGASQTINSPGSRLTIPEQYGTVVATYRATNTWILSGV
jgi:hypothetical protein